MTTRTQHMFLIDDETALGALQGERWQPASTATLQGLGWRNGRGDVTHPLLNDAFAMRGIAPEAELFYRLDPSRKIQPPMTLRHAQGMLIPLGVFRMKDDEIGEDRAPPDCADSFIHVGDAARNLIQRYLIAARREMVAEREHLQTPNDAINRGAGPTQRERREEDHPAVNDRIDRAIVPDVHGQRGHGNGKGDSAEGDDEQRRIDGALGVASLSGIGHLPALPPIGAGEVPAAYLTLSGRPGAGGAQRRTAALIVRPGEINQHRSVHLSREGVERRSDQAEASKADDDADDGDERAHSSPHPVPAAEPNPDGRDGDEERNSARLLGAGDGV